MIPPGHFRKAKGNPVRDERRKWGQGGDPTRGAKSPWRRKRKLQSAPGRVHTSQCAISGPQMPLGPISSDPLATMPVLPSRRQAAGWRCCIHGMGVGVAGGGPSRQKHGARLESRPVGAAAAKAAWGRAGLGMGWEAQFWVIAPEILPSGCRKGRRVLPPNLSRLEWQGAAAPPNPPHPSRSRAAQG